MSGAVCPVFDRKQIFKTVRIVGTNALRKATNSDLFVNQAESILGYPIEIIAGREEARLIYLGVAQTQSDDNERRLVVGYWWWQHRALWWVNALSQSLMESLHMGCVVFTDRFFAPEVN